MQHTHHMPAGTWFHSDANSEEWDTCSDAALSEVQEVQAKRDRMEEEGRAELTCIGKHCDNGIGSIGVLIHLVGIVPMGPRQGWCLRCVYPVHLPIWSVCKCLQQLENSRCLPEQTSRQVNAGLPPHACIKRLKAAPEH